MTDKTTVLKLTDNRQTFKPFNYPWAFDAWLKHEQSHWLHTEVPMLEDVKDWKKKLTKTEQGFLTNLFRFFTQGDVDVAGGYVTEYLPHFPQPEVRMMLLGFAAREALHIAAYSHLIETLAMPESTYNDFMKYDAMREKHEYLMENLGEGKEAVALKIAKFSAFTEGLQLFSTFIMLLNFPRHGKMIGMGQIVSWSIVDETMHATNMIKLFRTYVDENPDINVNSLMTQIYKICEKMVELEDKFIDLAFEMGSMQNLTAEDVKAYIRFIANRRLQALGGEPMYDIPKNPLPWVEEMINAPIHGSFFETRITDYAKGSASGSWADVWGQAKRSNLVVEEGLVLENELPS